MDFVTNGTAESTILYQYNPNPQAAIIFICTFGIAGILHFVAMIWLRTAYFIPLLLGCIMDCFGYYGRYWSSHATHDFGAFVLQSFMLILAPIFFSATAYMALARAVVALDAADLSPLVRPRWLSKLFVAADVVCFLVQVAGLGLRATTSLEVQRTGRSVLIAGLIVQCFVTAAFVLAVCRFAARLSNRVVGGPVVCWRKHVRVLAVAGALLLLRNVVRCAEYGEGPTGYVASHEAFIYVLDGLPMLSVVILLLVIHPGRLQRAVKRASVMDPSEGVRMVKPHEGPSR